MKAILLGNDTKEQIDKKIKDYLKVNGINVEDDFSFNIEITKDGVEKLVTISDDFGNKKEINYDEFLVGLEDALTDIKKQKKMQVIAAAGMLSRAEGTVTDVYSKRKKYNSNVKVAENVVGYGHKTISEHDYIVLGLEDVSPIVEQTLIEYRLTSFTVKSRRNVDFRNVGFYVPDFKDENGNVLSNNDELKELYVKYMESLFKKYGEFVDLGLPVEDCRFILPYSYYSNFIMGCNANEFLRITSDLLYGKPSKISELHELGLYFEEIMINNSPYLKMALEKEKDKKYYEDKYEFVDELMKKSDDESELDYENTNELEYSRGELLRKVNMTGHTNNPDWGILCSFLMARYQLSHKDADEYIHRMSYFNPSIKDDIMQAIIHTKNQREFEQVNFCFEIPTDLATLTHLTRHRMHSLLVPDFVPLWNFDNYIKPESIINGYSKEYIDVFTNNKVMMEYFKSLGVREEDLIYFYLSGTMGNVYTNMNGREVMWFSRMRSCNKAQWPVRIIANQMIDEVSKVAPLFGKGLGPTCKVEGYCPEGKDSCKNRGIVIKKKELNN